MKKIVTFLVVAFMTNGVLLGQCSTTAFGARASDTNLGSGKTFNLNYDSEAAAIAALVLFDSVEFPHVDGGTITILAKDLKGVSLKNERWRLKAPADNTRPFGGQSPFTGDVIFHLIDGTTKTCSYEASKLKDQ